MTTQQIIRVLIFALIFVVPVVIRIIKAAQEAKEKRRLEQLRQYQINEAMRTGRPVEPVMMAPAPQAPPPFNPQQSAQERLREMAARRQAQIEALRRQRGAGSAPMPPPMTGPTTGYQQPAGQGVPTAFQQSPGGVTGYQPATQPARPQARPQQRPPKRSSQSRDGRKQSQLERAAAQDFPPPTGQIGGTSHDHDGDVTHRLVPDAPAAAPVARPSSGARGAVKVSLGDLRQAIVLREVLGKPMALRDSDEG